MLSPIVRKSLMARNVDGREEFDGAAPRRQHDLFMGGFIPSKTSPSKNVWKM